MPNSVVYFCLWQSASHGCATSSISREIATLTPGVYLPSVAGNFIVAIAAGVVGQPSWGLLFIGAGAFTWLAMESVILHRMFHAAPLPAPLRPTLGSSLAPPVVAVAAWLEMGDGH